MRVLKKVLVGALLAGCALAVFLWQQQSPTVSVKIQTVTLDSVESTLQLTGKVINDRTVTITALLDGEITAILSREGDSVEKGDVLAELDSRQAQALVDKADAELVFQRQALKAAERNYERTQRLSTAGNASRQAMDDSLDQRLGAEASVKAAEATLSLNQLRLDNAIIRSPFAGTVISKTAETGQWLEAGSPLFTVVATIGTVIEATVNASDWSRIGLGQVVTLSTETSDDESWHSKISWIAPTVSRERDSENTVAVRFPIGDDAPVLLLGQEIDVDLILERVDNVIVVPLDALTEIQGEDYVAYVLDGDTARQRVVTLGITSLSDAEVLTGISEGDELLLPGRQQLSDGQTVSAR